MLSPWLIIAASCAFSSLNAKEKLCNQDVRVRNDISSFESNLRGCSVIAGNLEIALFEWFKPDDYAGLSFPELTEIRGYFLIYRVYGLPTLSYLFPNLTIIRGLTLFKDYSFILFDVKHLVEIGLHSLKYILRGSTRIENCPHLCHVDTVNWTAIGGPSHTLNFTGINNGECERCPDNCQGFCWNTLHCQEFDNCHPECLGCTKPDSADECIECRSYEANGTCISECPKEKIRHPMLVSCLTKNECYRSILHDVDWWPFKEECISECPLHYIKVLENRQLHCESCGSDCHACEAIEIDSNTPLEDLENCTHISGPLSIRFDSKSNVEKLYTYLGSIKEIYGYLRIYRSVALTSLEFFKKLRVIHGKELYAVNYSFVVYDNPNLYKLWNSGDNFTIALENGEIFFDDNPKLCPSEIKKFVAMTKLNYSEEDISDMSNGDNKTCNYIELNITIVDIMSSNVTFIWENVTSTRNISEPVGYLLSYIEDPFENITIFDEREDCFENNWESVFVANNNTQQIINLNAFTKYAYYITLYTNISRNAGHTEIEHFKTLSDDPSEPSNLNAISTNSSSVTLNWDAPFLPNGILGRYELVVYFQSDNETFIAQRNFCVYPRYEIQNESTEQLSNETRSNSTRSIFCCKEEFTTPRGKFEFTCDRLNIIMTADPKPGGCKNYMYSGNSLISHNNTVHKISKRSTSILPKNIKQLTIPNPTVTTYNVTSLKHFSLYTFHLQACHNDTRTQCSSVTMTYQRTLPKEDADDIPPGLSAHVDDSKVVIKWFEPKEPNALILSYQVQYKRTDLSYFNSSTECITRKYFVQSGHKYQIKNLLPGLYSLRVRAVSLAGTGKFSEYVNFEILLPTRGPSAAFIVGIVVVMVSILIGMIHYYRYYYKRKRRSLDQQSLVLNESSDYSQPIYVEDEWEIDREDVEIFKKIAQGTLVTVYNGVIKSQNRACAVKTMKLANVYEKVAFLNETSVMKWFSGANHVMKLLGIVSKGQLPLVLMELIPKGDLKSFLKNLRSSSTTTLTSAEMYRMAAEIADGMMYLSSKKFVHRDLAARNCMVTGDHTVKIGDFGISKDVYRVDYYRTDTGSLIPVRWMSPESLVDDLFTTDSDIWSYGVLLWELAAFGEQPYQNLTNEEVFRFTVTHGTLNRPSECPDLFYEVMVACWKWRPNHRPLFADIVAKFESHIGQHFRLVSFYHSAEGEQYRKSAKLRVYNAPALTVPFSKNTVVHWNALDDDVSI